MKTLAVVVLGLVALLSACSDDDGLSGARIAFISERDGTQELYVMNADGSGQTTIRDQPGQMTMAVLWTTGER